MKRLIVTDFGQVQDASIAFGDLTLFIGPQASGKSILLQLFKLLIDSSEIRKTLKKNGFAWNGDSLKLLELYFGENMQGLWKRTSKIRFDDREISVESLDSGYKKSRAERVFYIPAQRVVTLENGWPRAFMRFAVGDPYVVKNFSESLRLLMETGLGGTSGLMFPLNRRLKKPLRDSVDEAIFHGARMELDESQLQRRIVLTINGAKLPYMTWSAGQREFMPLLLGLYWLMPQAAVAKKQYVEWVIIEEPEMGLHPEGILSLVLLLLELMWRGYKVIVSTHSPVLPEAMWALRYLQEAKATADDLFDLFDLKKNQPQAKVFDKVLTNKSLNAYYFGFADSHVTVEDISSLDPSDKHSWVADWGGLTRFSGRASEIVSRLAQGQP